MLAVVTLPHGPITTLSGEATLSRGLSHHRITLVAHLGRALVAEHQAESSLRVQQLRMRLRVVALPRTKATPRPGPRFGLSFPQFLLLKPLSWENAWLRMASVVGSHLPADGRQASTPRVLPSRCTRMARVYIIHCRVACFSDTRWNSPSRSSIRPWAAALSRAGTCSPLRAERIANWSLSYRANVTVIRRGCGQRFETWTFQVRSFE